ncbi:MAG: DUF4913 domain-containing protein [Nocardiopsaceae bacterium]|nr:DUF4913 domain-containing protein [Nocardiopsaceae bacterium]
MSEWGDDYDEDGIEAEPIDVDENTGELADDDTGEAAAEPSLYYGSVDEFLREYLRHVYRRKIDGRHKVWAARWWEYDEAVIRLEALWRSWEHLRLDGKTGMSVWWRDHADHHMAVLMDPEGPFLAADATAEENQCKKGAPLPYQAPPAGLFPDVREDPGSAA